MKPFADHPSVVAIRAMLDRTGLGVAEDRGKEYVTFAVRDAPGAATATIHIQREDHGRVSCAVTEPGTPKDPRSHSTRWWYRDSTAAELDEHDARAIRGAYGQIGRLVARLIAPPGAELPDAGTLAESIRAIMDRGGSEAAELVAQAIASVVDADKAAEIAEALDAVSPSLGRTGP